MKKDTLLNVAVTIVTLCALLTTALVTRRELFAGRSVVVGPQVVSTWRSFASAGHRIGPTNPPITIVVFADFQCPFCGRLAQRLRIIRKEYPRDIAIVYRHFPLAVHRAAIPAVRASECAAQQRRFDQYHDAMFAEQDSVAAESWLYFARIAGIRDIQAFKACDAATGGLEALARDTLAGARLHVRGTPTFLINETRLEGAQPLDTLEAYVRRALKRQN